MLSGEHSQQWTQKDYMRLINSLFQPDTPHSYVEKSFRYFETNFKDHPNLISILLDYYFIYDKNPKYGMHSSVKSIIDLICLVPDSLCNKLFEKILEFMSKYPMQQLQQPTDLLASNCTTNYFERVTNLLVLLCYRKKIWLDRLAVHKLLTSVISILKSNTNQTELISVHCSLLFVLLINSHPTHMFQQHADHLFQIFINLFKYQCNLEQKASANSDLVIASVKWSVRLYFYVLYGFNAWHLINYLKKKEPQILAKESFTEKHSDTDRQSRGSSEDLSVEWRRYCLDPLFTNYNQVLCSMQPSAAVANFFGQSSKRDYRHLLTPNDTATHGLTLQTGHEPPQPLLSPSYLFAAKNKPTYSASASGTPNHTGQITFNYPDNSNEGHSVHTGGSKNATIKNLTTQFMMNESAGTQSSDENFCVITMAEQGLVPLSHTKPKSKSDTDLNLDTSTSTRPFPKSIPFPHRTTRVIPPVEDLSHLLHQRRLTSYDLRQTTRTASTLTTIPGRAAQSLEHFLASLSGPDHKPQPTPPEPDVLSSYFAQLPQLLLKSPEAGNSELDRMRQETNHLALQLVYERHLREKYEREANRLCLTRTERDQLLVEKQDSEKKLKALVERYKSEVEESLRCQGRLEVTAFQQELADKDALIAALQVKLEENSAQVEGLRSQFDELATAHRRVERELGESIQSLVCEKNLKTKHEIDYQYMNALKYTTDILRKKILLMSKSVLTLKLHCQQQTNCNQDTSNLNQMYRREQTNNNIYDQSLFESVKEELEQMHRSYEELLASHNANAVELENCKQNLLLKDTKLEEMNQSMQMDSIEMNAEIMKNQYRVYSSLMNVNRRLEEEVLKLRAKLNEMTLRYNKLERKQADQSQEIHQLLSHIKANSNTAGHR